MIGKKILRTSAADGGSVQTARTLLQRRLQAAALLAGAVIAWPAAAQATQDSTATNTATATQSVTVTARRPADDPTAFLISNSKVLGRRYAASCNFMAVYNPMEDDVTLDYLQHFYPTTSINDTGVIRDNAPYGDASTEKNTIGMPASAEAGDKELEGLEPAVKCSNTDFAFAAGRNYIMRKDKSLDQALAAYERGDFAESLAKFKENYEKLGYELSALMLGKQYLRGEGVPADATQAAGWLRKVVEARFAPRDAMRFDPKQPDAISERAEAAMILARLHLAGQGVPRDPRAARKYYEVAGDAGYVPATAILGVMALSGSGGDRDSARAVRYLKEAAGAGYLPALYQLGRLYYNGGDGVPRDLVTAGAYFAAAAKEGHAKSQYAAGRMYDLGESVAPDQQRAIGYYKEAAVKGESAAQNALATYFYAGEVVGKDLAVARKLFRAAAVQGQRDAMFNLAVMSGKGEGGPLELSQAYLWFRLAEASEHPHAAAALKEIRPRLSTEELAKADAILAPGAATARAH